MATIVQRINTLSKGYMVMDLHYTTQCSDNNELNSGAEQLGDKTLFLSFHVLLFARVNTGEFKTIARLIQVPTGRKYLSKVPTRSRFRSPLKPMSRSRLT